MRNFILRRLLQTLPMLLLASFIIFLLFAKTPGAFIDGNITLTAARAAELKAIYGLDQPLLTRYLHWLGQLLRGDLGFSLQYQIPVSQLLNQYIWNSFLLASVALVFYWGIGLAVGVVSALRPGSWFDHLVSVAVFAAMSFPTFFLCLLLIKWFAVDLRTGCRYRRDDQLQGGDSGRLAVCATGGCPHLAASAGAGDAAGGWQPDAMCAPSMLDVVKWLHPYRPCQGGCRSAR